jgi:O-antigen/teichoic acid export membrane protein
MGEARFDFLFLWWYTINTQLCVSPGRPTLTKRLLTDNGMMVTSAVVVNILSFLLNAYVARALGPAEFGALGSLLAAYLILSVPLSTLSLLFARSVATFVAHQNTAGTASLLRIGLISLGLLGTMGLSVIALISPQIATFLQISSSVSVILTGLAIAYAPSLSAVRGALQGLQNFAHLSFNISFEAAIRLLGVVFLVGVGFGLNGAIGAYGLAPLLALVVGLFSLRRFLTEGGPLDKLSLQAPPQNWLGFFVLFTCLAAMNQIDVVVVKHFFHPEEAGLYNAAASLGKTLLFVVGVLSHTMFPKVTEAQAQGINSLPILKEYLAYVIGLCTLGIVTIWVAASQLLEVTFGQSYVGAAPLLRLFGLAVGLMALVSILVHYRAAVNDMWPLRAIVLATVGESLALWFIHPALSAVVWILVAVNMVTFLSLTLRKAPQQIPRQ